MTDHDKDLEQAHEELEAAIRKVAALNEYPGLVTDWIVCAAVQDFDPDDGQGVTTVAWLAPYGGRVPYYRLMGLLDFALTGLRNGITDPDGEA